MHSPVSTRSPGLHLLGDLHDCACAAAVMQDPEGLIMACRQAVQAAGLTPVGEAFHHFAPEGGVTGVIILAESHVALHTWPEERYVTLDVFVCNYSADNRPKADMLFAQLIALFAPQHQAIQRVERS